MRLRCLLFGLLISFSSLVYAQELNAELDRNDIQLGESVQLTLTFTGRDAGSEPDLKPLLQNFDLAGTGKATQLSIVNGVASAQTQWQISLLPKKAGALVIPEIFLGKLHSKPLTIHVSKSETVSANNTGKKQDSAKFSLEAIATPEQPYIQSQVLYTLRLYLAADLQEASLSDPVISNALMMRLGDDHRYQTTKQGQRYQVIERRYAIFPQQAGKLSITGPSLLGAVSSDDISSPFAGFMTSGKPIRLSANSVELDVKTKPANFDAKIWLPSEKLMLTEAWSTDPTQMRVGEPNTRTITLNAAGLTGEQIPTLANPNLPTNLNVYPSPPTTHTRVSDTGVIGEKVFKLALIPNKAGSYTLPALKIIWWSTVTHQAQTASLPTRTITVEAASPVSTSSANSSTTQTMVKDMMTASTPLPAKINNNFRMVIAALLTAIIIVIGWIQFRRKTILKSHEDKMTYKSNQLKSKQPPAQFQKELENACQNNNAQQAKKYLIAWANNRWPDKKILTLGQVSEWVKNKEFKQAVQALDAHLYANDAVSWNGQNLWNTYQQELLNDKIKISVQGSDDLPPLYPS